MEGLRDAGFDIRVFAATYDAGAAGGKGGGRVSYRPSLFSADGFVSLGYLLLRHPLGLCRLVGLVLRLLASCAREAVCVVGNLHTIGFFARRLDREGIGHVHAYFLSWPAVIALALCQATRRSFSISAHARDIFVEHGAVELKVSRAKFVAVCTQQGLGHLKSNLGAEHHEKLHLCYHGMHRASERAAGRGEQAWGSNQAETIVAVGRLIAKKGFEDLLRAFALVLETRPGCRLLIIGDGPEREKLGELIDELSIADSVELLGWQPPDVTSGLIGRAAVLAVPSVIAEDGDRDGIPNVILEAFAAGSPVVASALDGIKEAVEHERSGLLVQPGNTEELSSALKRLLDDGGLRQVLARGAYEVLAERFDAAANIEQLSMLLGGSS
ncbi:MAG: glycosyltransferase family 4 protein [Phycisphaerales bacterium]|nr:MAG: glycosyltransferase family 4 protein [Phycisphaerales bacterium]